MTSFFDRLRAPVPPRAPTPEDAFLESIREAPDDDFPRLQYADWLEEQGHAQRAEFIRVQCELAGIQAATDIPTVERRRELRHRQDALWADFLGLGGAYADWLADRTRYEQIRNGAPVVRGEDADVLKDRLAQREDWLKLRNMFRPSCSFRRDNFTLTFRRGFIEVVACNLENWWSEGPVLVRMQPIREVVLTGRRPGRWVDAHDGRLLYAWYRLIPLQVEDPDTQTTDPANFLPNWLWCELHPDQAACIYDTAAAALVALSDAAIRWALKQPR